MPHVEIPQAEIKVVILGDSHIGKTSLVTRFAEGYYRDNSRSATMGANFVNKSILSSSGIMTKIQIWDTAGVESFRAMAPSYYKNASAILVCYDASRGRETYDGMCGWLDEVRRKTENVIIAIAALKIDLVKNSNVNHHHHHLPTSAPTAAIGSSTVVPEYEVEQLADALGAIYLPTSAKTGYRLYVQQHPSILPRPNYVLLHEY
jgi:small GTP-binding protein